MITTYVSVIEQVYDEFIEFIWNNLPEKLESYEVNCDDDLSLPMFQEKLRGDYDIKHLHLYPGMIIKPGTIEINPEGETRPTTKDLLVFDFSLWLIVKGGDDIENLQRQCERYVWAVKEITDDPDCLPTQTSLVGSIRRVYGIDWHAIVKKQQANIAAGFVDIELKIQINR